MNTNTILDFAKGFLTNVTPVEGRNNIFKGELRLGSPKPAGVYYLDLSGQFDAQNFKAYQEELLAQEYFRNSGNLQWNYYLILFKEHLDKKKKDEIEKDDKYARKLIFSEEEFRDFFKLEASSDDIDIDLVLEWRKRLDGADLQEVYGAKSVSSSLERFFDNETERGIEERGVGKSLDDALIINELSKITLTDQYRPFPLVKEFNFKRVNLITGINGVGKTSLFEAIELMLCGRTKRNPDKQEPSGSIKATFNKSLEQQYVLGNTSFYRSRDLTWYSNNYSRDNYLHLSFNRYNFFNSDAAYNFAFGSNEKDIRNGLLNLVLGPEYDHILSRANSFAASINREFNKLELEIEKANERIDSFKTIEKSKLTNDLLEHIKQLLIKDIKELKVKKQLTSIEEEYVFFEEIVNKVRAILEKLKEQKNYSKTQHSLASKLTNLNDQRLKIERYENEDAILKNDLARIQAEKTKNEEQILLLGKGEKYFSNKLFFKIGDIRKECDGISLLITQTKQLREILQDVDLKVFKGSELLFVRINKNDESLKAINYDIVKATQTLNQRLDTLGKVEKMHREIKQLGQQWLKVTEHATNCPLCDTTFSESDLKERIEKLPDDVNHEETVDAKSLYDTLAQLNIQAEILKQEADKLNKIKTAFGIINPAKEFIELPIDDLAKKLQENLDKEGEYLRTHSELSELLKLASDLEISESDFVYIYRRFEEEFRLEFSYENKDVFIQKKNELKQQDNEYKTDIEERTNKIRDALLLLKQDLKVDPDWTFSQIKTTLQSEESYMSRSRELFNSLSESLFLDESDNIDEIDLKATLFIKNLETFKAELKNRFEFNAAQKAKEDAEKFIKVNKEKRSRLETAKGVLATLTGEEANHQLEQFLGKNMGEIFDIFKTIHAPREFKAMSLEDSNIYLVDINDNKRRISEISTGQRSALAIAVFISLNRKLKNGPNVIMFDDPVSFIDDFNVLSFIDFLRFFILKENRQIFLATANTKLATLFERKFEYLEDDFAKWSLSRE